MLSQLYVACLILWVLMLFLADVPMDIPSDGYGSMTKILDFFCLFKVIVYFLPW